MNKDEIKFKHSELGYYLAGLLEGDGNIWTQKTLRSNDGRRRNPQIMFTSHTKDIFLYRQIKDILGGGVFYKVKGHNCFMYKIYDLPTLLKLINLINGKFRTPKILYFHRAIDFLNLKYNLNINKLPLDKSDIDSNP